MPHIALAFWKFGSFHRLMVPFPLGSTASLPCKMPLLLLGIIGLAAALLEFEVILLITVRSSKI